MKALTDLPDIGNTLAEKLHLIGITNEQELKDTGSENAIIKISTLEDNTDCINMLYALEGAIQDNRGHRYGKRIIFLQGKRKITRWLLLVK